MVKEINTKKEIKFIEKDDEPGTAVDPIQTDQQAKTEGEITSKIETPPEDTVTTGSWGEPEKKKRGRKPGQLGKTKKKKAPGVFTKEAGELWVAFLDSVFGGFNLDPIDKKLADKYAEVSAKFFDKKFGNKFEDEETALFIIMTGAVFIGKYSEAKDKGFTVWDKIKNSFNKVTGKSKVQPNLLEHKDKENVPKT